ncbi:unannotated protein [freshwater metagenome]|uniref:Unannotated protein n=1 Tax=freshwater metagenome TaxID=449393 RepID=A0A6J6Z7Y3_9ZZZZ
MSSTGSAGPGRETACPVGTKTVSVNVDVVFELD